MKIQIGQKWIAKSDGTVVTIVQRASKRPRWIVETEDRRRYNIPEWHLIKNWSMSIDSIGE